MKKISLVSLVLILAIASLFSDNVKALGSSFSLLIPDNYEDVKHFPDRLNLEETSHIEVGANSGTAGTGYLGFSNINDKINSRHEITYKSVSTYSSKYESGTVEDIEYIDFNNQVGFKLGKINFGITAQGSKDYFLEERSSLTEYYDSNYSIRISENYLLQSHENWDGHFGISTGLGKDNSLSISLNCDFIDYNDDYRRKYGSEYATIDSITNRHTHEIRSRSKALMYTDFNLSIIKDFGKNKQSRFYTKLGYRMQDRDNDFIYHAQFSEANQPYTYSYKRHSERNLNDGGGYNLTLGFGNVKQKGKLEIYSAIQGAVRYIEFDNRYYDHLNFEATNQDTISSYYSVVDENKEYYAELKLPFGLSYSVNKWCKIYGSLVLLGEYEKNDFESYEISNYKWSANSIQYLSLELKPHDNLQLGIYSISNLSAVESWEVKAKYLF